MDPTLAAMLGGAAGLVMGAVAVAATRWSEHSGAHAEPEPSPRCPEASATCSSVLRSIAVVVDASDAVVNTSASAVELRARRGTASSSTTSCATSPGRCDATA